MQKKSMKRSAKMRAKASVLDSQSDPSRVESSFRSNRNSYVTHGQLLDLAQQHRCRGIHTQPVLPLCRPEKNFWVFKAIVFKSAKCRGFVGYGDAHPGNVSPLIFNCLASIIFPYQRQLEFPIHKRQLD